MDTSTPDTLELCLVDARFLTMDSADSEDVRRAAEALLQRVIDSNDHQDVQVLVQIAQFIKELAIAHTAVSLLLLDKLDLLQQPGPFLDVLPEMFSSAPAERITELAQKLFEFASTDYLFVRALAVLVELPLDANLSKATIKSANEAIHRVQPAEYPTLFGVTLKAVGGQYGHNIIRAWRRKLAQVRPTDLAAVLNTVWTLLPTSEKAVLEWVQQMNVECSNNTGSAAYEMSAVDVAVLLLCISGGGGSSGARRCKGLFLSLLGAGAFPFVAVVELLSGDRQHEVWSRLHSPVWALCVWLLEHVPVHQYSLYNYTARTSDTNTITSTNSTATTVQVDYVTLLTLLVSKLFSCAPILRESVVTTLLVQCFPQVQSTESSVVNPGGSGARSSSNNRRSTTSRSRGNTNSTTNTNTSTTYAIPLPPLGTAHATLSHTTTHRTTTYTESRLLRRSTHRTHTTLKQTLYTKASTASSVLLHLSSVYSVVGEKIGRSVYDRLTQQLSENGKIFPSPVVCARLLQCAAMGAATSTQQESALLILIQKLISTLHTTTSTQSSILSTLFTNSNNASVNLATMQANSYSKSVLSSERRLLKMGSALPLCMYSASTFGIVLAGQMLLREYSMCNCVAGTICRMGGSGSSNGTYSNNGSGTSSSTSNSSTSNSNVIQPVSAQDRRALVTWIVQCSTIGSDLSGLYALDVLSVCLYHAVRGGTVESSNGGGGGGTSGSAGGAGSSSGATIGVNNRYDAEWVQHLQSALHTVYSKLCAGFGLTNRPHHQTTPDLGDFNYHTVSLNSCGDTTSTSASASTNTSNNYTNDKSISSTVYSVSDLATLLVHTTLPTHLAHSTRTSHVVHALHEVVEVSSVVYSMLERAAFVQALLCGVGGNGGSGTGSSYGSGSGGCSVSSGVAARLSFPKDINAADPSLSSWSVSAGDSVSGEFVLLTKMTVHQALKLAWERGLVVALLAGTIQAMHSTNSTGNATNSTSGDSMELVLKLLCQLHTCRSYLRAAHAPAVHTKRTNTTTTNTNTNTTTPSATTSRGTKRALDTVSGTSNGAGSNGRGSNSNSRSSGANAKSSPSGQSPRSNKETTEFVEELQLCQRVALQRLLTRSVRSLPYDCIVRTLHDVVWGEGGSGGSAGGGTSGGSGGSAGSAGSGGSVYIPATLLTDAGLALVSQFVYRVSLQGTSTSNTSGTSSGDLYDNHSATDRFVSLFNMHSNTTNTTNTTDTIHTTATYDTHALQSTLVVELISLLPPLLDWLERARVDVHKKPKTIKTDPGSNSGNGSNSNGSGSNGTSNSVSKIDSGDTDNPSLGSKLDRAGVKIGVLNVFALFEMCMQRILHTTPTLLHTIADRVKVYEKLTQPAESSFLTSGADNSNSSGTSSDSVGVVYRALEQRLLVQHDSAVVTAGLRCLYVMLNACGVGGTSGSASGSTSGSVCMSSVHHRLASIGWSNVRNTYEENLYLASHMLHTDHSNSSNTNSTLYATHTNTTIVPGMDDTWPLLVHIATNQHYALHYSLQELHQRCNKKTDSVVSLFKACFSTRGDTTNITARDCAAYRLFYSVWWSSEVPGQRVYGVSIIMREVFKLLFTEHISTKNASSKKRKKEDGNSSDESDAEYTNNIRTTHTTTTTTTTVRRLLAPETLLHKYLTPVSEGSTFKVKFLRPETIAFHLNVMLPLLPALFLLAQPNGSVGSNGSNGSSSGSGVNMLTSYGPYTTFVHTSMLFLYLTQQLQHIMDDAHEHLVALLEVAPLLTKVCRAVLVAVDASIAHATQWRNSQTQTYSGGTRTLDSVHDDTISAPEVDLGCIDYFECMLQYALYVAYAVHTFAQSFQDVFVLSGGIIVNKALMIAVPALFKVSSEHMTRIFNVAKLHSCVLSTKPYDNSAGKKGSGKNASSNGSSSNSGSGNGSSASNSNGVNHTIGDKCMLMCMRDYLARHDATVLNPLSSADLHDVMSSGNHNAANGKVTTTNNTITSTHNTSATHTTTYTDYNPEDDVSDSEDSFGGFEAVTNNNTGWGLYNDTTDTMEGGDDTSVFTMNSGGDNSGGDMDGNVSGNCSVYSTFSNNDEQSVQSQYSNMYNSDDNSGDLIDFNSDDELF